MKEYRVTFLVQADTPEEAVNAVSERLNDGGEPNSIDVTHVSEPSEA